MGFLDSLRNRNQKVAPYPNSQIPQNGRESERIPTVQELESNPIQILRNAGYNIPNGMTDPKTLSRYMIQTGQVRNGRLQTVQKVLQMFR